MKQRNKINIDDIDLEKERDKIAENPGLISFPHSIGSALVKPEDNGKIKGRAIAAMHEQCKHQLDQLYEQMKVLADQAHQIKNRVEVSERIYLAQINFEPIIGKTYYLYERKSGEDVLSMIAPLEWGNSLPFKRYIAEVTLLSDHTWEVNFYDEDEA